MKTSFSGDSENHSHTDNEMGSSVKLVTEKVERVSDTKTADVNQEEYINIY